MKVVNYSVGGARNNFMYKLALCSIREAENDAREQGKKIYLIIMSA